MVQCECDPASDFAVDIKLEKVRNEQSMTFTRRQHHYLVHDSSAQCNTQGTPCFIIKTLVSIVWC